MKNKRKRIFIKSIIEDIIFKVQYYIFADFHLGFSEERDKKVFENFFKILNRIPEKSTIVFLGDIFDFWFEYKTVIPKENFLFVSELYKYRDKFEFLYFTGNHDFFVREFVKGFNMRIFQKERIFQVGNKRVLFAHGDFYYNRDILGTYFNFFIRTSFVKFLFYLFHPDIGIRLAKTFSKISRNSSEKKEVKEEIPPRAEKFFKKGGDICILGHFHKPMFIEKEGKIYVNTGEFPVDETYVFLDDKKIILYKNEKIIKQKVLD